MPRSRFAIMMSNQWIKILALSLLGCVGMSYPAIAELGVTRLQDVLAGSKTIIQGRCLGSDKKNQRYQLDVERVLRGQMAFGQQTVPYIGGLISYPTPSPCLGFLNQKGQLEFVAFPAKANGDLDRDAQTRSLDTRSWLGVIKFTDRLESHVVVPNVISLSQIENYLKSGKLIYSFEGKLHFFSSDQGDLVPSNITIKATYELFSKTSTVQGLPVVAGISYPPKVDFQNAFEPEVTIQYGDEQSQRFLEIGGKITGLDPTTSSLQVDFWGSFPIIYRESGFRNYISNSNLISSYVTLSIVQKDGTHWTLTYNKAGDIADETLSGFRNQSFPINYSSSYQLNDGFQDRIEVPLQGNGTLVLAVNPTKISKFPLGGGPLSRSSFTDLPLLQTLMRESIECRVRVDGGTEPMPPTPCRLELDSIRFNTVSR